MGFGTMDFGGGSNMNAPLGSVSAPLATKREGEEAPDLATVEEKAAKPNTGRVEGAALKVPSAALHDEAAAQEAVSAGLVSSADAQMAAEVAQFARGTYGADARRIDADFLADMAKAEFAADKEKLMERCDKYVTDRISEVHEHGNLLNDMHPFTDANAYAQTLISYVRGGWNEIATDEFRAVQKAVAEKDRAGLVRMFGITEMKDEVDESAPATIPGAQSITGYVPQYNRRIVRKTDEEIDAEINDGVNKAMARNFMFLYNAMKPELSDEGAEIVDHVITNGKFDPADADAFRRLYAKDRDEADRVYFLAQSARPTAPALGTDTWYETKKMMLDMGEKSSTAMDALWRRFVGGYESYRLSLRDKERYERMIAQGVSEEVAKKYIDRDVSARKAYDLADEKDRLEMRRAELELDALDYHKSYEGYNWWQRSAKGIAVTLPYMGVNAAPYGIGFVINCFYHMQDIEDQINLDGGDPTNGRALRALGAVAWAGVEKLEFMGMFGRTLTRMEKRVLWKHFMDAGVRKMAPAGWEITKAYGKEMLAKTAYETFQEGVQGAIEAAEYDIGFFNHLDPKKRKDAHDVLVDATGRFFTDMKESVGTMAGMALGGSALGTVRNVNRQYRAGLDRESIDEMIRRNNAVDAMVDGTWVNPDVSGTKPEHRRKVLDRLVALWTEAKDRDSAMEAIRAEFGFTEDQAGQVADWLDLRQATLDGIAREYGTEELGEAIARLAEVSHRFRIGNDTAYDVADFYRLLNPNIRVEDVEIEDATKEPVAVADSERLAGLRAEKAEAERKVRDAKVGSARRGAQRELRRINRKIAAEEARKPEPKRPTKTLRRVTIPMVKPDGTATEKHIVISEESNGIPKDIRSEGFAVSVAAAMRKAGIPLGGIDMKDDESERKAAAWFQNLAENNEADAMQIVLANGLFDKGRFEVVDEETGKTLADADGIITLARKVANESLKAGNLTLGHEHTHAVIKFARQIGVFGDETDPNYNPAKNDTVVAMRKLFGDPKKSDELFDEEYFGDALAAFLRDEYDFAKHTSADNRLLTERILDGVGNLAKYAANRILGGFGVNLVTQREVNLRREGQIAAFQAIRQGDFRGLSKYAGIRFTGGAKPKAAPATVKTPAKAAWRLRKGGAVNVPTEPTDASTGAPDAVSGDSAETARLKAENERLLHELNVALEGGKVTVPARVGGVHEVKSPISNLSMKVQWEWIPRKDVVPAKSGSSIQERFRTLDEASKDRLRRRASKGKFMPDRFTFNTIGDRGAPIVAGGNICLSGNGRMILLSLVAERGGYSEYLDYVRQWCRENGIPDCPADMLDKEPVLVQRIVEAPSQEAVEQFARECNRDDKEPLGSAATAKAGVRAITPALMRLYDVPASGDFMSKSNWPFIEKFYEALGENVPKDELTKSILPEAGLRVQRAFLAKILGGDASEDEEYQKAVFVLIGNLLSGGNSTATVRDALTRNGAELFAMLGNRGSYNVIPELRAAVETYVGWRAAVQRNPTLSLKDYVDTPDFFRVTSPIQDALTQLIETRYFNAVLKKYNELVAKQSVDAQAMLDIAGAERLTSGQLLAMAEREVVEKDADGNPVTPYVTKDPSWGGYALQPQSAPAVSAPVAAKPEPKPSKDEERKRAQAERDKAMEEHLTQMSPEERAEYDAIMAKAETMPTVSEMMAAADEILRKREDDKPFVPCPAAKGTAAVPNALAPGRGELRLVKTAQNGNTTERTWSLGAGVWDYLRIPYFTSKLPKPSKQDEAGRGLWSGKPLPAEAQGLLAKYQGKCPRYMGNKNAMTDRTVRTLWEKMSKAERAHYTAVVDCFGGGGCWGLTMALTCFPNANRLIVNEFDAGRLEKIRLLQTRDGSFEAEVRQFFTEKVFGEAFDAAVQMARGLIDFRVKFLAYANSLTLTPDERGMIQAVYDNMMSRLQFGEMDELGNFSSALQFEAAFKEVGEDAVEATELAQAYAARGGSITYVCGDAKNQATFGAKVGADGRVSRTNTEGEDFSVPSGDSVVKVCDPPYDRTTGYNDDGSMSEVGFDENPYGWGYKDTEKMLSGIVDSGSAIVYTDEAWFYGKDFKEQKNDADYGQAGLFALEESLWKREQDVLCGIINNLDHFDVAGDVASRFETLGVHHGHRNERAEGNADAGGNGVGQESQAADGAVHGRGGVDGVHQGVDGMAAGAAAEDGAVHGRGDSSRGRGGVEESADRAVAKETCVQAIEEAVEKAGETVTPDMDTAIRHSVRLVREERMADYARLVSSNAPRWLRARRRALDRRMDEAGYTERVWHGTEGDDFNVFRFGSGSHGVRASYFTYRRGTAENYAALRSMDAVDLDNAKPNVRQYYVNPGRVLDLDEGKPGHATTFQEFVAIVKKAYADGYDSVRVMNAYDDQGFRFNGDETMENMVVPDEAHDVKTDILIVFDRDGNQGANRVKAADSVTFADDGLPIPTSMRADIGSSDVRYSVRLKNHWSVLRGPFDTPQGVVVTSSGGYSAHNRELAWGLKLGRQKAIDEAARIMAPSIPDNAVIVPMPNHEGRAVRTMLLAYAISGEKDGVDIVDALEADPHETSHHSKKIGIAPKITMRRRDVEIPPNRPVVIVDNVYASGATFAAAKAVLPEATINVLADAGRVQVKRETPAERHSVFIGIKGADKAKIAQGRLGRALEILDEYELRHYEEGEDFDPSHNDTFRRDTYVQTGWWMGTDGMWRYEIGNVKPKTRFGKTVGDGSMMKNGIMFADRNDHSHGYCDIESICRNNALFRAYPELKDICVKISDPDTMGDYIGQYDPVRNQIKISWDLVQWHDDEVSNVLTAEGVRTITHELQHAVQEIEDFSRGGNVKEHGATNYRRLAGEVEARNVEHRDWGVYDELSGVNADEKLREEFADSFAPWFTEDVPQVNQILIGSDGAMRDQKGNPVARHSVRVKADLRSALTFSAVTERDAKATVKSLRDGRIRFANALSGRQAELKSDWTKIFSEPAKKKSDSYDAHYAAANRIDTLFENGVKMWEEKPRNGSADIRVYAKYGCPFEFNDSTYLAKLTVKEYADLSLTDGFYSVEAISVEKIGAGGINAGITSVEGHELDPDATVALSDMLEATPDSIAQSVGEVNGEDPRFSVRVVERDFTEDDYNRILGRNPRGRVPSRHAVRATPSLHSHEDLAVGLVGQRLLAGKETKPEYVAQLLSSLGVKDVSAADAVAKAEALVKSRREAAKGRIDAGDPALMTDLATEAMKNRVSERLMSAYATGAADMDPDLGRLVQKAIDRRDRRMLDSVTGFTAAEIRNEFFIDPSEALLLTAEYEKTPEEKAKAEAEKAKREEEKKRRKEEGENPDFGEENDDAPAPMEVPADVKATVDALLDGSTKRMNADQIKALRKKLEAKRKAGEQADSGEEGDAGSEDDGGVGEGDGASAADFDVGAFNLIKPVFTSNDHFSYFLIELMARKLASKYPELGTTDKMWKNPVAVKELQRTAQHILAKMAHDTLGVSMARAMAMMDLTKLTQFKKLESTRRWIAHVYGRIHEDALRLSRRKLVRELISGSRKNGTKGLRQYADTRGRFSSTREDLRRKIDAKTELFCRRLIPLLTMSEDKLDEEIAFLKGRIAELEKEAQDTGSSAKNDSHYVEARDTLALAEKYGGMVRWMPADIVKASSEIRSMLDGRLQDFETRREERRERDSALRNALMAAMAHTDKKEHLILRIPGVNTVAHLADSLIGNLEIELRNMLRYCTDENLRRAALDAVEEIMYIVSRGTEMYNVAKMDANAEVNAILKQCYGDADKGLSHLNEELPEDVAKKYFKQKPRSVFKPTYAHLLQLYASCIQYDYRENVQTHGRAGQIEAMANDLTAEDLSFHAATVNWYAKNRQALSEANEEITGLPVESPDRLYVPVRTKNFKAGMAKGAKQWGPVPSALTRRTKHDKDFDEGVSFLDMIGEGIETRAQLIGYGMAGIRLRDILSTVEMRETADRHGVRADLERVIDHVQDVLMQGMVLKKSTWYDRMMNWGRRWVAKTALSWNAIPAVKQLASMPVWANLDGVGFGRQTRYLTDVSMDALDELRQSDGYRSRYVLGWSEETQNILRHPSRNWIGKFYEKGMVVNKAVDSVSCLWMAQGYYRDMVSKYVDRGFSEEEAKRRAATMTWARCEAGQQSGRVENMNVYQRNHGEVAAAIFQFMTAPLLQANYEYQAIKEVAAGTPGAKGRLLRALVINHILVPGFMEAINLLWNCVCGQPPQPDDEEWRKKFAADVGWQMLLGSCAPLYVVPRVAECIFDKVTGRKSVSYGRRSVPAEQTFDVIADCGRIVIDLGKYGLQEWTDAEFMDEVTLEKLQKELDRVARTLNAPYRQVSRIYKGWNED